MTSDEFLWYPYTWVRKVSRVYEGVLRVPYCTGTAR